MSAYRSDFKNWGKTRPEMPWRNHRKMDGCHQWCLLGSAFICYSVGDNRVLLLFLPYITELLLGAEWGSYWFLTPFPSSKKLWLISFISSSYGEPGRQREWTYKHGLNKNEEDGRLARKLNLKLFLDFCPYSSLCSPLSPSVSEAHKIIGLLCSQWALLRNHTVPSS